MQALDMQEVEQVSGGVAPVAIGIIGTAKAVNAAYRTFRTIGRTTGATERKRENLGISDN